MARLEKEVKEGYLKVVNNLADLYPDDEENSVDTGVDAARKLVASPTVRNSMVYWLSLSCLFLVERMQRYPSETIKVRAVRNI